jgi:tRNA-splicing ligase RtcB
MDREVVSMKRVSPYKIVLEREGDMQVEAEAYVAEGMHVETEALDQLRNSARLPTVVKAIAMPDIHVGYGVPIGAVVATTGIVSPAAVGYDINCGMRIVTTPLEQGEVDPVKMAETIRRDIPLGEGKTNVKMHEDDFRLVLEYGVSALKEVVHKSGRVWDVRDEAEEHEDIERIQERGSLAGDSVAVSHRAIERGLGQLATLGGGNHFIEVQVVESVFDVDTANAFGLRANQIVVMIHSGSRGFGHQVADDYMKLAKARTLERAPNRELCFLDADSDEAERYVGAMNCAANFGFVNRQLMAVLVRHNLRKLYGERMRLPIVYDVAHNIVKAEEHDGRALWVHRKGATRAFPPSRMQGTRYADVGQPVLIPGSMGTASYVLVGTEESKVTLHSVNHGAGRVMSRSAAAGKYGKKGKVLREAAISDRDFQRAMHGIHLICEDKRSIKEEAPQAYKNIDQVIRTVADAGLARIVARLRPLAVLKG